MDSSNSGVSQQAQDWEALIIQSEFSIPALAKKCGISIRQLQRQAKAVFQKRLGIVIGTIRLAHAHERLLEGAQVKEVAFSLGYKHVSHFSRSFRKRYGYCASDITRQLPKIPRAKAGSPIQLEFRTVVTGTVESAQKQAGRPTPRA